MSWNKNTVIMSNVDAVINTLKNLNASYTLTELGKVVGNGLNDSYYGSGIYPIRRLEYGNKVVLEAMSRNFDCDSDDYLVSVEFEKDREPKDWKIEYVTHDDAYCDGSNEECSCQDQAPGFGAFPKDD